MFSNTKNALLKPIKTYNMMLTHDCNCNCNYCFQNNNYFRNNNNMKPKTCIDAINYIIKHRNKDETIRLTWFGGEPFLNFETFIVGYNYITNLSKKQNFEVLHNIYTNGTIWNNEIEEFFKNHPEVRITLSWDGLPELQNKQRSNSNKVEQTIKYIMNNLQNELVINTQITCLSTKYMIENFNYIFSFLKDDIFVRLCIVNDDEGWKNLDNINLLREKYGIIYNKYKDRLITNSYTNRQTDKSKFSFCKAGKQFFTIDSNGDIYACPNSLQIKNKDKFKLGSIYTQVDTTFIFDLDYKKSKCYKCGLSYDCRKCLVTGYTTNNDMMNCSEEHCQILKNLAYGLHVREGMDGF